MKKLMLAIMTSLGLGASSPTWAAAYSFDIGYSGGGVAFLEAGSDDPVGTNLQVGDTFLWNLHAANGADYWDVFSGGSLFPFMAFPVGESGQRTGDWTLTLRLDGSDVLSASENGSVQAFVHVGTNSVLVSSGLQFDEMILSYALTASDAANATITSMLSYPGMPPEVYFTNNIAFVQNAVPEPSALLLFATGLIALAGARRSRR